ncbi:MATE family efflux transporter [Marinomonas sp. C2222]|uniref:MATE family efflux transporter n=1 Tax=Marinomonas sargassi TaxID=2984494 RepID=A0ABT2YVR4_9GAMM|nr:MATE family efflux transporter [Marinomonas sargassi]MCV2403997.1 MATE family efflux transporter [Marinomonas sargassi]
MSVFSASSLSLSKQLFNMTWPMLFGILSLMSFQLVDSAFIGQLGVLPLAAQGFTLPMQMVVIGVQVGLGIATTSVISRALGSGNSMYSRQLAGLVLVIGGVGIAALCFAVWLFRGYILLFLSAPEEIFIVIESYWPHWLLSAWMGALIYFYYSICRSNGNTLLPGIMMVITSLLNLVLDPIFIFTLDLGLNGAAMATTLSFGLGVLVMGYQVFTKQWLTFNWQGLKISKSLLSLGHIMGPAMISQLFPPIASMIATKLIASFGAAAVAAWALGSRFEFFSIVVVLALTMSMPPMVGRLYGAKKIGEIKQLVAIACCFILGFQLLIAIATFFASTWLAGLMTSEPYVSNILRWHLVLIPISLGALGICMLMVSVLNALGRPYVALLVSALRLFAFFVPGLWLGAEVAGLKGLFAGVLIANVVAGGCAWSVYLREVKLIEQASS